MWAGQFLPWALSWAVEADSCLRPHVVVPLCVCVLIFPKKA